MGKSKTKAISQRHHLIYGDGKNKEVIRTVRKGVHFAISMLRRFTYLTDEEIETVKTEVELKRRFIDEKLV